MVGVFDGSKVCCCYDTEEDDYGTDINIQVQKSTLSLGSTSLTSQTEYRINIMLF